jgi:glycosyltransferase involved in cell wall biosynthesis
MPLPFDDRRIPRVSVIIPAYNAARTIGTALASVRAQSYIDYEVIVVDDGSTDGTRDALEPWLDSITYIYQPNGGPARARNTGIARASGSLIAFLDADDAWLPEKLTLQVEYFRLFPETGLVHSAAFIASSDAVAAQRTTDVDFPFAPPRQLFCDVFETEVEIHTLTVMVSRAALDAAGGFDERREVHVEDWDLWLRIAARFPIGYLRRPLALRRPGGGMSAALERTFAGQQIVLAKALPVYRAECQARGVEASTNALRPWHRCAAELGYAYLERNDLKAARRAFRQALRYAPTDLRTHAYHLACHLPARVVDAVRRMKRNERPQARLRIVPPRREGRIERPLFAQDTLYRRTRHRLADGAHDLDDGLARARGGARTILFEAASPVSFAVFKPVYLRLARDPRVNFYFTSTTRSWPAEAIFRSVGITNRVIPASKAAWMRFDACINTDFYEMTWLHRRTVRLQMFHGVAGKYNIDAPVHVAPDIAAFDRLLFPNTDRLRRYLDAGLVDERAALLVGYPKVDCLVDGSLNRRAVVESLRLRADVPTVLYAPTWSPDSSLHLMGEAVIHRLVETGFNVLVKLHDRSYDLTRRASGGVDWMQRLSVYDGHERVRVVRDADSTPYLMAADALVTDHSSVGFEYCLLDRPLVVLEAPRLAAHAMINPEKIALLRAAAEVVEAPADIEHAIVSQLRDPAAHARGRRLIAEEMFYRPGTATDRAAAVIYDAIHLEYPGASAPVSVSFDTAPALTRRRSA